MSDESAGGVGKHRWQCESCGEWANPDACKTVRVATHEGTEPLVFCPNCQT